MPFIKLVLALNKQGVKGLLQLLEVVDGHSERQQLLGEVVLGVQFEQSEDGNCKHEPVEQLVDVHDVFPLGLLHEALPVHVVVNEVV